MGTLKQTELARLTALSFAHRGLHGAQIVENSRAAFEAAIAAGFGIELDVQASRDGDAFVLHDATLDRLTDSQGAVAQRSSAELRSIRLKESTETVPTLAEIVQLVGGRTPLLIEVKASGRRVTGLCRSVFRALHGYTGSAGVMSFNPEVPRWFASHSPSTLRGLVVTEAGRRFRGIVERRVALWRGRPDFLAYDIRDLPSRSAERARARGLPILTWTCRGEADRARAAAHADQVIFEHPQ